MLKTVRAVAAVAALSMILFAGFRFYEYWHESKVNRDATAELVREAVEEKPRSEMSGAFLSAETEQAAEEEYHVKMQPSVTVDVAKLQREHPDIVGWIRSEDTTINYPVVQGQDNDYYLHRLPDGRQNSGGTIFMDFRNSDDFSDWNTIIYGHNMKNGSMFGTLTDYNSQEYFEKHPVMFLFTTDGTYRIELLAGCLVPADSELYTVPESEEGRDMVIQAAMKRSTFRSVAKPESGERIVTLSTCSYEYEDARYVLIGCLRKIDV